MNAKLSWWCRLGLHKWVNDLEYYPEGTSMFFIWRDLNQRGVPHKCARCGEADIR